jgi:hypothetical protein
MFRVERSFFYLKVLMKLFSLVLIQVAVITMKNTLCHYSFEVLNLAHNVLWTASLGSNLGAGIKKRIR